MKVATLIFTIIGAIGGLGSFGCFVIAIKPLLTAVRSLSNETLFGEEAREKYKGISGKLPSDQHWGPCKWEGGQGFSYMLEVKQIIYDSITMGNEWKNIKQSVRRVYMENGEMLVEGWRIK